MVLLTLSADINVNMHLVFLELCECIGGADASAVELLSIAGRVPPQGEWAGR
eukprot:gene10440-7423_t